MFPALDARRPDTALRFDRTAMSFATLHAACERHAGLLGRLGVKRGTRVAVWAHPTLDTLLALVGNVACGVVSVPLNPELGRRETRHILDDADPVAVLSTDPEADGPRCGKRPVTALGQAAEPPRALPPAAAPADPLLVLYTSGTTGAPKGALLSAGNIAANLDGLIDAWALSPHDTVVHALPVFHAHGLVFGLFGALRAGAALHWTAPFRPETLAAALRGPSRVLYAVPTMLRRLCDAAEQRAEVRAPLASPRLLVSGSAALPEREHARLEHLSGQRPVERYGLTETLINTAIRHDGERLAGTVGVPLQGVELRLVDDQRRPIDASAGAMGEVAVRGPSVFVGYLNRPDATAAVRDAEGWFYTGDLGTLEPNGYLRLLGRRATDLIKTGGFKVGAGEVEAALLEHPAVSEAAVVGAADADLGERIVAHVVLRADARASAEELIEHCTTLIARHKRPREVRFVSSLPRNAMGKVQKKRLRG